MDGHEGPIAGRRLGARWDAGAEVWHVGVWSPDAAAVHLEVSARADPGRPVLSVRMDRDGEVWWADVPAAAVGDADLYGFRAEGEWNPGGGCRFDPSKVLLDPYATQVVFPTAPSRTPDPLGEPGGPAGSAESTESAESAGAAGMAGSAGSGDRVAARRVERERGADTGATAPRGVLRRDDPAPLVDGRRVAGHRVAAGDEVIYEAHVRGFTRADPSVGAGRRGTFAGLVDRLPYLADLGITVLELLPVHAADPGEGSYWGYMPFAWLAVEDRYAAGGDGAAELAELCAAAAEHRIAVWLDVVYNHSDEEDEVGPIHHLRGLADGAYYVTRAGGAYVDDAGCGNILRAAHPVAADLVLASLDRLASLGVTGFRFDLATIVGRDIEGRPQVTSDLCDRISAWAAHRGVRLVAEAWDVASYQVGPSFPGRDWAQWNDRFRDDVRGFLRGEESRVPGIAFRVQGSPDLFPGEPRRSVNFVDAHDGFTLYDLVSYDRKHNEANGWDGRDGTDENRSWNCGFEGDEADGQVVPGDVLALRRRQMRNALVLLLTSQGMPMFVAGDEFARTQHGNNNPYNQDNEISWVDWSRLGRWADLHRFARGLIHLRRRAGVFGRSAPWDGEVTFVGANGPLDANPWSRSIGWYLRPEGRAEWFVIANAWWERLPWLLPGSGWHRVVDTSLPAPDDIADPGAEIEVTVERYPVGPRSCVILTRDPASTQFG